MHHVWVKSFIDPLTSQKKNKWLVTEVVKIMMY
jgi:hypothetical protein